MSRVDPKRLSKRRFLMGNPYAHIEQLLDNELRDPADLRRRIHESRIKLQNQYAYLDGDGELSASEPLIQRPKKTRTFEEIEQLAIRLQRNLWKERSKLWPEDTPTSHVEVLDSSIAASLLGFDFHLVDGLGVYTDRAEKVAVAGMIDRSTNEIKVSRDFPVSVQNFTAAHELGHAMLHADISLVHRDRATDGTAVVRDRVELEADKFATYFLLPGKLVRLVFRERFLTDEFALNDDTAFALLNKPLEDVANVLRTRRKLSRKLASATQYNGRHFYSLAEYFNVTVETMAIRLEELNLVDA